jgi:histidinol phosphatase-like PHP family hydrolase
LGLEGSCGELSRGISLNRVLTNSQIAEHLLRLREEEDAPHRREALRRAARSAMTRWPEEAADLAAQDRPLADLPSVGPWLARGILRLLEEDEAPPETPELRRGFLTLAEARATLAENPDWPEALQADLQMHTTYSDGKATLREMAAASAGLGYRFVAITDHSQSLKIARGMDEEELAQEGEDVVAVNEELAADGIGLRVLHAIEMDLDTTGDGDMDPAALARLDLVLGAFHSKLRIMDDQTDRYMGALRNPTVTVIAHPRGRRFDVRLGLQADWPRVVEEAAAQDKALEIDAYPDRQDLSVELLELAREAGCRISIGTDAHSVGELRFMEFGLAAAIRAGIPQERILNFQPVEEVLEWSRRIRGV